ncbi:MAG: hypothetical protein EBQ96_08380 [Proteobacteria bacterium]|nr:hypothetical protein [Pseudomonadota bacterium]
MALKRFAAGILAAYMAGAAALSPLHAQNLPADGAQQTEQLPDVIDPDTGKVYPLTPDQKRVLQGFVIKCEDDLIKKGMPEDVASESCQHVINQYIRDLKKAPPEQKGPGENEPRRTVPSAALRLLS